MERRHEKKAGSAGGNVCDSAYRDAKRAIARWERRAFSFLDFWFFSSQEKNIKMFFSSKITQDDNQAHFAPNSFKSGGLCEPTVRREKCFNI